MKAVVWHGIGDIRLDDVPDPRIEAPTDVIIDITASAICGTDLHFVRGTVSTMVEGTILGHEAVGVVRKVGADVRNLNVGDRVVVPSTIACGVCSYCRAGYYSQCDQANPNGPSSGTAFFGGPKDSGAFAGLQAEQARIPFGNVGLVKLPDSVSDEQAILISDIFPTGYFGADLADIKPGHTVAVFGAGPVGQFAIASAKLMGAGRIFSIDRVPDRLAMARAQGAETINFEEENPVETLKRLTGNIGPDSVIDAVGVDAQHAHGGPAAAEAQQHEAEFQEQVHQVAPQTNVQDGNWIPGDAPTQALMWAVESVAKAGTVSIIGVYPETVQSFPLGAAMGKNLTIRMGNCNHRKYIPRLVDLVASGVIDPTMVLSQLEPISDAISAYEAFDRRMPGWIKVELDPRISVM